MKPHLLAIRLIETMAAVNIDTAKSLRETLIDLLDETRNVNGHSITMVRYGFIIQEKELIVDVTFNNYGDFNHFSICLPVDDFVKHLYYNGDGVLFDQDLTRLNVFDTLLGVSLTEVCDYIDDICNGRVSYKTAEFKTV